jgi:thiol-disulfide isomerase/thioredoxin
VICAAAFAAGCRPAAAPVAVSNRPVSVNGMTAKDAPSRPTKRIAEMSWTAFSGEVQKLKDFQGRAVILDFWATNCPPCIEEIPHLLQLKSKYGDDLEIVGLHVGDEEDRKRVPEFVDRLGITYTLAYPEDALVSYVFGQETAIPQTAIFGRDGKLLKKITGFNDEIQAQLDKAVEEAVGVDG